MTEAVSSPAARIVVPRWLDARVAVGLLLVLVSVAAGARIVSTAGHLTPVYAAAHDLVPGEQLTSADLAVVRVRLDGGGFRYLAAASAAPVGYVVTRVVSAHELLPAAALTASSALADTRMVTVPVQAGHLPADLGRGDLVDVYVTPKAATGRSVRHRRWSCPRSRSTAGKAAAAPSGGSRRWPSSSTSMPQTSSRWCTPSRAVRSTSFASHRPLPAPGRDGSGRHRRPRHRLGGRAGRGIRSRELRRRGRAQVRRSHRAACGRHRGRRARGAGRQLTCAGSTAMR